MVLEQGTHAKVKYSSYVCQDIVDSLDKGVRSDVIIIDFSKALDLVPQDRLHTKIVATRVDLRVVIGVKEFLMGHLQRVRVDWQLSEEVRLTSGVLQGSILGHLLFHANVNDILRNIESNIRLFIDD